MLKIIFPCIAAVFFYSLSKAQMADSTLKKSPVKTITNSQYNALLKGEDLYGMPLVAELNHYPLPDKAIKFKKELSLSPIQVGKLTAIAKELHRKRVEMGAFIIRNERALDSLFQKQNLVDGTVLFYANRSGLYYGELRNAILQACLSTGNLLAPEQIKRLETLQNH